jgi:uncharacterized membrane protein SpoIIM required for sporulation/uncharacterized RDD family membrane protein YckC
MADMRPPPTPHLTRRLSVETPEHVILEFELAGIGSRTAAAIYDAVVVFTLMLLFVIASQLVGGMGFWSRGLQGWAAAVFVMLSFLFIWGYFVLFEALAGGRTPGKRRLGIRVVMDTGHPITFAAASSRNLLRLVDVQPLPSYVLGLLFVFFHPQNKRLGDIVAGTIVVRDRPQDLTLLARTGTAESTSLSGTPELTDDEFRLLQRVLDRLDDLEGPLRQRFLSDLERRFAPRYPNRDPDVEVFLAELCASERRRREGVLGGGRPRDGGRRGGADRFVALNRDSWERFRHRAAEVERTGLKRLTGPELIAFAETYREVAADLARARTYDVDPRVIDYLARIVSTSHNALYGVRGAGRLPLRHLLLKRLPTAAYHGRAYILTAALFFALPAASGYILIRERPAVAYEVLPDVMISRAEAGQAQAQAGRGYAETPSPYLPLVASSIIANNVQVAFGAFAFGVTAGVGTLVVLSFNGLFFGAVLGLFANYGLATWLLTFVAGHGILELTAIFMAGGAGLLIGRAVVAPGDLMRRDALVRNGRLAIELVGAAACLLLLAGTIEGFLSASNAPTLLKLTVSAASAVLVAAYFAAGRRAAADEGHEGS